MSLTKYPNTSYFAHAYAQAASLLVAAAAKGGRLPPPVVQYVLSASEGVPLNLEQVLSRCFHPGHRLPLLRMPWPAAPGAFVRRGVRATVDTQRACLCVPSSASHISWRR